MLAVSTTLVAQSPLTASSVGERSEVVLVGLSKPEYPTSARAANVWGEVKVEVRVARDGTVESAVAMSGHPLLKDAAIASAKQARFECRACSIGMSYVLFYKYELHDGEDCCGAWTTPPTIEQQLPLDNHQSDASTRVIIAATNSCLCNPAFILKKKVRSPKCLYLWKCSVSR